MTKPLTEGDRLRRILEQANVTQAEFARAAGVSRQRIGKIISEKHFEHTAFETVKKGLREFDIPIEYLRESPFMDLSAGKLLEPFGSTQWGPLLRIIESSEETRRDIRLLLQDRLSRPVIDGMVPIPGLEGVAHAVDDVADALKDRDRDSDD